MHQVRIGSARLKSKDFFRKLFIFASPLLTIILQKSKFERIDSSWLELLHCCLLPNNLFMMLQKFQRYYHYVRWVKEWEPAKRITYLIQNIYSLKDVKRCEQEILKTLKFRLHRPTAHTFLDFFAGRLLHQFNWVHEPSKRITNHLVSPISTMFILMLATKKWQFFERR